MKHQYIDNNPHMKTILGDILSERERQISKMGFDLNHDDEHTNGEIASLAAWYAMPETTRNLTAACAGIADTLGESILPSGWKPPFTQNRRTELIKSATLILAEIERIDRIK